MKKLFRIITITLILLAIYPATVCLAIADPDTMTVNSVEAYQDATETGDQLYIVTFTIDYAAPPSEAADEAFLIRFLDNGSEIAAVTPYAYYNDGYSDGAISFYFASDDTDLPTWNENDITIQITGNPSLSWDGGDPPVTNYAAVDTWNSDTSLLAAHIRYIANALEDEYSVDLISIINGSLKLTAYGEDYFDTICPVLRAAAPTLYTEYVTSPVYVGDNHTLILTTTLDSRLDSTPFDQTDTATELGISKMWITTMIWLIFSGIVIFAYGKYIGTVGLTWVAPICIEVGAFGGWMPTEVAIGLGIVGGLLVIYPLFFRSASV